MMPEESIFAAIESCSASCHDIRLESVSRAGFKSHQHQKLLVFTHTTLTTKTNGYVVLKENLILKRLKLFGCVCLF
jgi:hypothetical protein